MRPLRVSVSHLDQFRLLMTEDWMDDARYLDSVAGVKETTPAMQIGIDLEDRIMCIERDYTYTFECTEALMLDKYDAFQVKLTLDYEGIHGCIVTLVGIQDAIAAGRVVDWKATGRSFSYATYAESMQWRAYLVMSGYKQFRYEIFQVQERTREPGTVDILAHNRIDLDYYRNIHSDVVDCLRGHVGLLLDMERDGRVIIGADGRARLP